MDILIDKAADAKMFSEKRKGLKTILSETGRLVDLKGIYAFIENAKVVYLDESSYVFQRVIRQFKGSSKYQKRLAHLMVEINKTDLPSYDTEMAIEQMKQMKIAFMDIPDDLERKVTTLYLQCQYECIYNNFAD